MRKDSGKRVVEEISPSVDSHSTLLEYYRVEAELRRIHLVVVVDIADVIGVQRDIAQMQRPLRIGVNVNDFPVSNSEPIYLERVDALDRVLPALVFQRHLTRRLGSQLGQVDVHVRVREQDVSDDMAGKQFAPLNVKAHLRQIGDRRIWMSVLRDDQPVENQ